MTTIVEIQYFPPCILFKSLSENSHVVLEQFETYQKMSFRNRCVVAGANGSISLSIPLSKGRSQKELTKNVRIDNRGNWQAHHWKTISSCYNRSPWFEFYLDELKDLYRTGFEFLVDWNFACFTWVLKKLDFDIYVNLTEAWRTQYNPETFDDWRNRLSPRLIHEKYPEAPRYRQVFEERIGFIPHLSILDLLFCEGKNARAILTK